MTENETMTKAEKDVVAGVVEDRNWGVIAGSLEKFVEGYKGKVWSSPVSSTKNTYNDFEAEKCLINKIHCGEGVFNKLNARQFMKTLNKDFALDLAQLTLDRPYLVANDRHDGRNAYGTLSMFFVCKDKLAKIKAKCTETEDNAPLAEEPTLREKLRLDIICVLFLYKSDEYFLNLVSSDLWQMSATPCQMSMSLRSCQNWL